MNRQKMDEVLQNLTEQERKVLVLRFGLEDGHHRTLEEVGQEFGVTRERIRQIEAKALRTLRPSSYVRYLRPVLVILILFVLSMLVLVSTGFRF